MTAQKENQRKYRSLPYLTDESTNLILLLLVASIFFRGLDYLLAYLQVANVNMSAQIEDSFSPLVWVVLCWLAALLMVIGKHTQNTRFIVAGCMCGAAMYLGLITGAVVDLFAVGFSGIKQITTHILPAAIWSLTAYSAVISREADKQEQRT